MNKTKVITRIFAKISLNELKSTHYYKSVPACVNTIDNLYLIIYKGCLKLHQLIVQDNSNSRKLGTIGIDL